MPALQRRRAFIPELLETHAEELEFLWARRRASLLAPTVLARELQELNERIEAHLQGLLVAGDALLEWATPRFAGEERDAVFAAAYPLLRCGQARAMDPVAAAFGTASGATLAGLADALLLAPSGKAPAFLADALAAGPAPQAVAAAAALAVRGALDPASPRLASLIADSDPALAATAWRVAALCDVPGQAALPPRPYPDAVREGAAEVREAAMAAAAWRGEAWVPVVAGRLAAAQDALGVRWLAATGGTDAAAAVGAALAALPPGPERCQLAARYGHPSLFAALLGWMESDDPLQAAAAGAAFTRMTGVEVEGRRVQTQGDDAADEFAREFAPEVFLPDLAKARAVLAGDAARWQAGGRWCRGHDLATSLSSQAQRAVDMQARWDFGMRAAIAGSRIFGPPALI
jgi:hypothetical protein